MPVQHKDKGKSDNCLTTIHREKYKEAWSPDPQPDSETSQEAVSKTLASMASIQLSSTLATRSGDQLAQSDVKEKLEQPTLMQTINKCNQITRSTRPDQETGKQADIEDMQENENCAVRNHRAKLRERRSKSPRQVSEVIQKERVGETSNFQPFYANETKHQTKTFEVPIIDNEDVKANLEQKIGKQANLEGAISERIVDVKQNDKKENENRTVKNHRAKLRESRSKSPRRVSEFIQGVQVDETCNFQPFCANETKHQNQTFEAPIIGNENDKTNLMQKIQKQTDLEGVISETTVDVKQNDKKENENCAVRNHRAKLREYRSKSPRQVSEFIQEVRADEASNFQPFYANETKHQNKPLEAPIIGNENVKTNLEQEIGKEADHEELICKTAVDTIQNDKEEKGYCIIKSHGAKFKGSKPEHETENQAHYEEMHSKIPKTRVQMDNKANNDKNETCLIKRHRAKHKQSRLSCNTKAESNAGAEKLTENVELKKEAADSSKKQEEDEGGHQKVKEEGEKKDEIPECKGGSLTESTGIQVVNPEHLEEFTINVLNETKAFTDERKFEDCVTHIKEIQVEDIEKIQFIADGHPNLKAGNEDKTAESGAYRIIEHSAVLAARIASISSAIPEVTEEKIEKFEFKGGTLTDKPSCQVTSNSEKVLRKAIDRKSISEPEDSIKVEESAKEVTQDESTNKALETLIDTTNKNKNKEVNEFMEIVEASGNQEQRGDEHKKTDDITKGMEITQVCPKSKNPQFPTVENFSKVKATDQEHIDASNDKTAIVLKSEVMLTTKVSNASKEQSRENFNPVPDNSSQGSTKEMCAVHKEPSGNELEQENIMDEYAGEVIEQKMDETKEAFKAQTIDGSYPIQDLMAEGPPRNSGKNDHDGEDFKDGYFDAAFEIPSLVNPNDDCNLKGNFSEVAGVQKAGSAEIKDDVNGNNVKGLNSGKNIPIETSVQEDKKKGKTEGLQVPIPATEGTDEIDSYVDANGNVVRLKKLTGAFEEESSDVKKYSDDDTDFEGQPAAVKKPDPHLLRIVQSPLPSVVIEDLAEEKQTKKLKADHKVCQIGIP